MIVPSSVSFFLFLYSYFKCSLVFLKLSNQIKLSWLMLQNHGFPHQTKGSLPHYLWSLELSHSSSSGKCTYSLISSNQLSTFLQPSLDVNWQDLQLSLWFPCRVQLGPFQFKRNRCGGNSAQPLKNCCHKRQRWNGDLNLFFFFFLNEWQKHCTLLE